MISLTVKDVNTFVKKVRAINIFGIEKELLGVSDGEETLNLYDD